MLVNNSKHLSFVILAISIFLIQSHSNYVLAGGNILTCSVQTSVQGSVTDNHGLWPLSVLQDSYAGTDEYTLPGTRPEVLVKTEKGSDYQPSPAGVVDIKGSIMVHKKFTITALGFETEKQDEITDEACSDKATIEAMCQEILNITFTAWRSTNVTTKKHVRNVLEAVARSYIIPITVGPSSDNFYKGECVVGVSFEYVK